MKFFFFNKYAKLIGIRSMKRVQARKPNGRKLNKRQVRQVKNLVSRQQEHKIFDNTSGSTGAPNTGVLYGPLTAPSQGPSDSQRTGDRITLKKITFRESMIYADTTNHFRLIIFQWYQNSALATPALTDILQTIGNPICSAINDTNMDGKKFKILHDKVFNLTQNGANAAAFSQIKLYGRRIARKAIQFNPGATSGFNHIYMFALSDSAAIPNPSLTHYSRVEYIDS